MMINDDKNNERPSAYPKPSKTDEQLNNQPEYVDQEPNSRGKDISDLPASQPTPKADPSLNEDRNPI
ncbi:MAG: hypothetical protein ABIN57_02160 [Chitinophagaceae bacterium]